MRGRLVRWGLPLALLVPVGVGAAMAASSATHAKKGTVRAVKSTSFGTILVSSNGRTLYRYTVDHRRVNRCSANATCNKYWPPLLVKAGAKPTAGSGVKPAKLGTIKAANGRRQVTYAGWPLYYFAGDKRAGQTNGQAFGKEWYVVNAAGALVKHEVEVMHEPTTTTTPTTTSGGTAWG